MGMLKASIAALAAAGALMGAALAPAPASAKDIVINMAAPDWLPTRFMQEEFDKTYKAKSGNNVKLVIDFIPWGSFYQRVAASLSSGEKKYQMIVTYSQWLGDFVEGGHYLKLNKYIDADPELQAIVADLSPKAGAPVLLFVNGFGATPLIELYLMVEAARKALTGKGLKIARFLTGSYVTSLDMAGCSITVTALDEETTRLWDAPVRTAALRWGL